MREFLTAGAFMFILLHVFFTIVAVGFIFIGLVWKMKRFLKTGLVFLCMIIISVSYFTYRFYDKHEYEIAMRKLPGSYEGYALDNSSISEDSLRRVKLVINKNGQLYITENPYTLVSCQAGWGYFTEYNNGEFVIYGKSEIIYNPFHFFMMGREVMIKTKGGDTEYLHFKK